MSANNVGGLSTTCRGLWSSSTTWVPGTELRSLGLAMSHLDPDSHILGALDRFGDNSTSEIGVSET